jgi:hypothetical protein
MTMRNDTRKVLTTGVSILSFGIVMALLTQFAFGGIGRQGPHTNGGWLCLMFAMGCLPTGTLTLLLGLAKLRTDSKR